MAGHEFALGQRLPGCRVRRAEDLGIPAAAARGASPGGPGAASLCWAATPVCNAPAKCLCFFTYVCTVFRSYAQAGRA